MHFTSLANIIKYIKLKKPFQDVKTVLSLLILHKLMLTGKPNKRIFHKYPTGYYNQKYCCCVLRSFNKPQTNCQ